MKYQHVHCTTCPALILNHYSTRLPREIFEGGPLLSNWSGGRAHMGPRRAVNQPTAATRTMACVSGWWRNSALKNIRWKAKQKI